MKLKNSPIKRAFKAYLLCIHTLMMPVFLRGLPQTPEDSSNPSLQWINPTGNKKEVVTIFFPGIAASTTQCTKNTHEPVHIPSTQEKFQCARAAPLIKNPYVGHEVPETQPHSKHPDPKSSQRSPFFPKIQEWLSHWEHQRHAINKVQNDEDKNEKEQSHSVLKYSTDFSLVNLAQDVDIKHHAQCISDCEKEYPNSPKILWGFSRGAATTFNSCALHWKNDTFNDVKLVVLEGCFDSVQGIFSRYPLLKRWKLYIYAERILEQVTSYKQDGIHPIDLVDTFPENVPVVFVTSEGDKAVPWQSSHALASALANREKNPVYFIKLKKASHSCYAFANEQDRAFYLRAMHTIYAHENLPYIKEYADLNGELLEQLRLSKIETTRSSTE